MTEQKRPPFLSALCILTFIGSGIAFIGFFLAALFFKDAGAMIIKYSSWSTVEKISPLYFIILMALYCLSLIGAIRMWKFHRGGFYIYSTAQLVILLLPVLWIGGEGFSMTNTIFTLIFVTGYLLNMKALKS